MTRDCETQCCFPSSAVLTTMELSENDDDFEYIESETPTESDNDSEYLFDSDCSNEKVLCNAMLAACSDDAIYQKNRYMIILHEKSPMCVTINSY